MGKQTGINVHHELTDQANAVRWRIAELDNDIEILSIREENSPDRTIRMAYKSLIAFLYAEIDILESTLN